MNNKPLLNSYLINIKIKDANRNNLIQNALNLLLIKDIIKIILKYSIEIEEVKIKKEKLLYFELTNFVNQLQMHL